MHTFWITGIPAAGKTIVSYMTERRLLEYNRKSVVIDGDLWRAADANTDYTFLGRLANVKRIGAFAQKLNLLGYLVFVPTCSPSATMRRAASNEVEHFHEVYLSCSEAVARSRKPEEYGKADAGVYHNYPVVHTPYEVPETPALVLDGEQPLLDVVDRLFTYVIEALGPAR